MRGKGEERGLLIQQEVNPKDLGKRLIPYPLLGRERGTRAKSKKGSQSDISRSLGGKHRNSTALPDTAAAVSKQGRLISLRLKNKKKRDKE